MVEQSNSVQADVEAELRREIEKLKEIVSRQRMEIERLSRKLISMWGEA